MENSLSFALRELQHHPLIQEWEQRQFWDIKDDTTLFNDFLDLTKNIFPCLAELEGEDVVRLEEIFYDIRNKRLKRIDDYDSKKLQLKLEHAAKTLFVEKVSDAFVRVPSAQNLAEELSDHHDPQNSEYFKGTKPRGKPSARDLAKELSDPKNSDAEYFKGITGNFSVAINKARRNCILGCNVTCIYREGSYFHIDVDSEIVPDRILSKSPCGTIDSVSEWCAYIKLGEDEVLFIRQSKTNDSFIATITPQMIYVFNMMFEFNKACATWISKCKANICTFFERRGPKFVVYIGKAHVEKTWRFSLRMVNIDKDLLHRTALHLKIGRMMQLSNNDLGLYDLVISN